MFAYIAFAVVIAAMLNTAVSSLERRAQAPMSEPAPTHAASDPPSRAGAARVVAALFLLWEVAARWWIDPTFLSPPSRVVASLGDLFDTQGVPAALRITFWELAVAFAISVVIGLVVGLAVGLSRFSNRSLMPIILLLYGTPQITILPLFILYFGIGPPSKIAFGVTPRHLPDHRHHRRRRAEHQADPDDGGAFDGREPLADFPLGDLPAHDPERSLPGCGSA